MEEATKKLKDRRQGLDGLSNKEEEVYRYVFVDIVVCVGVLSMRMGDTIA